MFTLKFFDKEEVLGLYPDINIKSRKDLGEGWLSVSKVYRF